MRLHRLTARTVQSLTEPGRYADGGGLYLSVRNGGRSWVFLYRQRGTGRPREMGLGSLNALALADARQKAAVARSMIASGVDPLADKKAKQAADSQVVTFGAFTAGFLKSALPEFRNEKHRAQWKSTLETYAAPIWDLPVNKIETEDIRKLLEPIWQSKHETARRVRGRIERVLSAAKAARLRDGENPARWKDNLQPIFGKKKIIRKHHPALPYKEMPAFFVDLRKRESISARALEFTILTAARTNETIGARWQEFDLEEKIWTIPAERMKMKKEHRVPLADGALDILKSLKAGKPSEFVFKERRKNEPLSDMAMLECLRDLRASVTVHGFRSTFRDWCGDETNFPRELAEAALAHKIGDGTEQAYRRSDAIKRRRELMDAWAGFCVA